MTATLLDILTNLKASAMGRKWKPNASQRREFAERMKDPDEQAAYQQRKADKADRRRAGSQFSYESAGGMYVPTREQHDFAISLDTTDLSTAQTTAISMVCYGYTCNEKVHHDHIHLINELRRKSTTL